MPAALGRNHTALVYTVNKQCGTHPRPLCMGSCRHVHAWDLDYICDMANSTSSASLLTDSQYQNYLDIYYSCWSICTVTVTTEDHVPLSLPPKFSVGVVVGGMSVIFSDIFTATLSRSSSQDFRCLRQNRRLCVHLLFLTRAESVFRSWCYNYAWEYHRYSPPACVFSLIEVLNKHFPDDPIELHECLSLEGNRV